MYELFYKIYFDSELTEAQEVYYAGESVVVDIAGIKHDPPFMHGSEAQIS